MKAKTKWILAVSVVKCRHHENGLLPITRSYLLWNLMLPTLLIIMTKSQLSVRLLKRTCFRCSKGFVVFFRAVFQLTTPENTITYLNPLCLSPQNFAQALSSVSLGSWNGAKRKWKQCLCKILWWQTKRIKVCYGILWSGQLKCFSKNTTSPLEHLKRFPVLNKGCRIIQKRSCTDYNVSALSLRHWFEYKIALGQKETLV